MPIRKAPIDSFSVIHNARMTGNGKPTCAISGASPIDYHGFPAWNAVTYHPIFCMPKVNANRNPAARKSKRPLSIISKSVEKLKEEIENRENGNLSDCRCAEWRELSFSFPGF